MKKQENIRRWVIWALSVAFYFYEYFLRVAPSVMVSDLFKAFSIGAGTVGVISAAYLYAYAPMQLPIGVLMDRLGARRLLTLATLICGVASILFGITPNVELAILARFLMGTGSAFAFIGMVYICSHWFHGKVFALLVGVGNSLGMLGAVFGEGPFAVLVDRFSWRPSSIALGVFGILLGLVIYLVIRKDRTSVKTQHKKSQAGMLEGMKKICKNPQTWINGIVAMMFYTGTVAYGGLWAIPFFEQGRGYSNEEASFAASMIYIGWIVAAPIIGHFSDRTCNRKSMLFTFTLLSIFFFSLITYTPLSSPTWIFPLMFLLGVSLSAQLLCYCLAVELNTPETKGAALALTNFLVFIMGAAIQTAIGALLDFNCLDKMKNGIHTYGLADFQIALAIFPATMAIAFILTFFIREKDKPWCLRHHS